MSRSSSSIRSSSKSGIKKKMSFSIWKAKFCIVEDKTKPSYVEFDVEKYIDGSAMGTYTIKMGMISCWVDPNTNFCVKAHLYPSNKSLTQMNFLKDLQKVGETRVSSSAAGNSLMTLVASDQRIPTADGWTSPIRYGCHSTGVYRHNGTFLEDYQSYFIYDSKAIAFLTLVDHLRLRKTIGGLSMVNFTKLPDDILQSVGYEMIPDQLGRGFPMWKGNPETVTEASAPGYGSMRWERQASNAESFLELVQRTIS
jgi:hypothetical protein